MNLLKRTAEPLWGISNEQIYAFFTHRNDPHHFFGLVVFMSRTIQTEASYIFIEGDFGYGPQPKGQSIRTFPELNEGIPPVQTLKEGKRSKLFKARPVIVPV